MPDSAPPTVAETLYREMKNFSPSERRIARRLLSDYPSAGLSTATELAQKSSTSTPTVIRFTAKLGFPGFAMFQVQLRSELTTRVASPASRVKIDDSEPDSIIDLVAREMDKRATLISKAHGTIPPQEIVATVNAIADTRRTILTAGGKFSTYIARYLQLQLSDLRPRVYHLNDPLHRDLGFVTDAHKRDVFVIFDFRRYEADAVRLAELAKAQSATVILVTDLWLSPAAALADIVLPVAVDASVFDSLTVAYALIESLLPAVVAVMGEDSLHRMQAIEALRRPQVAPTP